MCYKNYLCKINTIRLDKQRVILEDWGIIDYQTAWDRQEKRLQEGVSAKSAGGRPGHWLVLCEHPAVYTLGKSGNEANVLIGREEMAARQIQYFRTNRGGDITFHGPQQVVGYPILDLEQFYTDIGRYLRELEQVIIDTLAVFGIAAGRSKGETGVWIDAGLPGRERKICAMGVRCSRWITMHGFALNVNTDLSYFNHIVPCGIQHKQVTSMEKELGRPVDMGIVKETLKLKFAAVFGCELA
jgi:lipoyl(octanoyl) transferase